MNYKKVKLGNEENVPQSIWSTDDNILCENNKTLRENLSDKVDKVEGKSLIDNTEIERLKDVNNYDDTKVKNSIDTLNEQYNTINAKFENGEISNIVEPAGNDIPRVYLSEGTLPTTKDSTTMKFEYRSKTKNINGYVDIKCQGNSSMDYPKKNFTIKLYSDVEKTTKLKQDFKGWGKQNKFVLKANWIDLTHARNVVTARLWGDIVKSRDSYNNLPELLKTSPNQGAVDGFPVLVYSNGVYQGRYTLNIPKDKWMSNMDDSLDTHCILCGENYVSGCFRASANINGSDWTDELRDIVPTNIKTRWNEVIDFVMNSTDEEFKANLDNYIDVESAIDYLLFGIVSTGLDAFGKNQLYLTYDGQKWFASMYDMDSTWGLWWNGSQFVSISYSREQFEDCNGSGRNGNLLYIRLKELFVQELKDRYSVLRNTVLTNTNILNRFEEFISICPKDIVSEDYASTTGEGNFTGIPSKTTNNIQQLRSYIKARLSYCDNYINSLEEKQEEVVVECTGITLNNSAITFTDNSTQTLVATVTPTNTTQNIVWSVSPTGICSVNNGVITPIANGTCTITATCGTQNATCNIIVENAESNVGVTALKLNRSNLQLLQLNKQDTSDNDGVLLLHGDRTPTYNILKETGEVISKETNDTKADSFVTKPYKLQYTGFYSITPTDNCQWVKFAVYDENMNFITMYDADKALGIASSNTTALLEGYYIRVATYPINNSATFDVILNYAKLDEGEITEHKINTYTIKNNPYYDTNKEIFEIAFSSTLLPAVVFNTNGHATNIDYIILNNDGVERKVANAYISTENTNLLDENTVGFDNYSNNYYIKVKNIDNKYGTTTEEITSNITSVSVYCTGDSIIYNPLSTTILTATITPTNATNQNVVWASSDETVATVIADGLNATVIGVSEGTATIRCTAEDTTNGVINYSCKVYVIEDVANNATNIKLFNLDSTCYNSSSNTLIDSVNNISADIVGTPTISDNKIVFDGNSSFTFDISGLLNLFRFTMIVKFTPTTLDKKNRAIYLLGNNGIWDSSLTAYINDSQLRMQFGIPDKTFSLTGCTIGNEKANSSNNRIPLNATPQINTEYEVIISCDFTKTTDNIRYFVNGEIVQNGNATSSTSLNLGTLTNADNNGLLIGNYSSIEIYSTYCSTYDKVQDMVENAQ